MCVLCLGNLCEELHAPVMPLIQLINDCWTVAGTPMRKHLLANSSFVKIFLTSTQEKSFDNLNEVALF